MLPGRMVGNVDLYGIDMIHHSCTYAPKRLVDCRGMEVLSDDDIPSKTEVHQKRHVLLPKQMITLLGRYRFFPMMIVL